MSIVNIAGIIRVAFSVEGSLINAAQGANDAIFTIDLRPSNPLGLVTDNLDYPVLGWDINDVVAVVTIIGPQGEVYRNEDFDDPDIEPATSRFLNKNIAMPLDPLQNYENVLSGNYTLKVTWYNSVLDEYYNFLKTYNYSFEAPTIENTTVSGPYTGILTSTDTTDYGNFVHQVIRTHTVQYPTQLGPGYDDIVSSNAQIQVTPIYTNKWNITINSFVEYRFTDTLRVFWQGEGEFEHCVYGGCIGAMYDAINTMLTTYYDAMACNLNNQEIYQKRITIVNTAWHLLNQAYWLGDAEEADNQAYVIQKQVAYSGSGICGGSTSEEVTPCPPWTGGGTGGTYTFSNALVEAAGNVTWGGSLVNATTINMGAYEVLFSGSGSGNTVSQSISASGGILQKSSDGSTEGRVYVTKDKVTIERADMTTSANTRGYEITADGLVEKDDYRSGYTLRSLVSKEYVDSIAVGLSVVSTDATITGDGTSGDPLVVATPFPGFTDLNTDYGYVEPTHAFSEITSKPTTLSGYGITDAISTFLGLSDTPSTFSGFGNYFLQVNSAGTAIQFTSSAFVAATGGTFTGQVIVSTSIDRPLVLKQIGAGSSPGTAEAGLNIISFQDNDGDEQGYIGMDASGNAVLKSKIIGSGILLDGDTEINGDLVVPGTLTIDTINEATANNGVVVDGVTLKDGLVDGVDVTTLQAALTIENGLTEAGDVVKLGGSLTGNTTIGIGAYDFIVQATSGSDNIGFTISTSAFTVTDAVNSKGIVYAGDYSAAWTDHSLVTKKWVTDNFTVVAGDIVLTNGTKQSGVDAGLVGTLSYDDDYLYICTTGGAVGVAVWKRVALSLT
jgi:hypothetical protein